VKRSVQRRTETVGQLNCTRSLLFVLLLHGLSVLGSCFWKGVSPQVARVTAEDLFLRLNFVVLQSSAQACYSRKMFQRIARAPSVFVALRHPCWSRMDLNKTKQLKT
jgi:hypothetical protein